MTFWRRDFTKEQIQYVLEKLKPLRKIAENGEVSLMGGSGRSSQYIALLVSAVGFEVKTNTLKAKIMESTLFSPDLNADFTEKDFRRVAYRLRHKFQDEDVRPYKVIFPLWNIPSFVNGMRERGDVAIDFSPSMHANLFKTITRIRDQQRLGSGLKAFFTKDRVSELNQCSTCIAHVKANSPPDAYERASQALYEILGLINIARDGGKYWRMSFRTRGRLPVSEVLIGPHTTVHSKDGSLAYDGFWYEDWKGGPSKRRPNEEELKTWEQSDAALAKGVKKSPWSELCRSAVAKYFKAFSNPNLEESFLDGWRLFENISGNRDDSTERKLIRVSNVFEDTIEHRIIGKHLALRRNLITHGHSINAEDEETLAFQMLQFVHPFLINFIMNPFSFTTREEFWEFLDLPDSRADRSNETRKLRHRLLLLEKAAQFRGEA